MKRLRKRDQFDVFNTQFLEYVSRDVLEQVAETEINQWKLGDQLFPEKP